MVSTGTITRISAALLVMLVASAPSAALVNPDGYYYKNEHKFEQDVEGDGYAMVYQKVNTNTLQLLNYMHGSGKMDAATLISSNQSQGMIYHQDRNTLEYMGTVFPNRGNISFVEQNEMTYSPVAMVYGTGWYEKNPIVYSSKLKEKTVGKSYQIGATMHHQIEYASAFKKDIAVDLQCLDPEPGKVYNSKTKKWDTLYSSSKKDGYGLARMKIEEEVIEGVVHIGQLLTEPDPSKDKRAGAHGWKDPLIEIDENYHGTFRITKNMEISQVKSASSVRQDWLSCCIGGYDTMHDDDKMWGEKEIFDCTCRDVAWGKAWNDTSKAQYCRDCK